MRALAPVLPAALLFSAALPAQEAADPHGHGAPAERYNAADYTPEQRERIERLFHMIICACPDEKFYKTLAGCPDRCADIQKNEVRRRVREGRSDAEILAEQRQIHGTEEVLAVPDSTLAHVGPYLALGALAAAAMAVLALSVRGRAARGPPAPPSARDDPAGDAVERDLKELDR